MLEVCRRLGVTETTFYRWRKKYHGVSSVELRKLKLLRDENRKLKQLVAELSLDKQIPAGVRGETILGPRARRAWVAWVAAALRVSTRQACRATGVARSTVTYRARRPAQDALRRRLRDLAQTRVSY
ncbi:hypothetical protein tb265_48870 [Gemmatimonadetes bacterium T265]|nr:hypothetical protein tb265_48870 [Gemmatimonadetes bacterium T265]